MYYRSFNYSGKSVSRRGLLRVESAERRGGGLARKGLKGSNDRAHNDEPDILLRMGRKVPKQPQARRLHLRDLAFHQRHLPPATPSPPKRRAPEAPEPQEGKMERRANVAPRARGVRS